MSTKEVANKKLLALILISAPVCIAAGFSSEKKLKIKNTENNIFIYRYLMYNLINIYFHLFIHINFHTILIKVIQHYSYRRKVA